MPHSQNCSQENAPGILVRYEKVDFGSFSFIGILLIVLTISIGSFQKSSKIITPISTPKTPTPTITLTSEKPTVSLFVPYWTLGDKTIDTSLYDSVIYFGITPNENGINTQEDGYKDMQKFLSQTESSKNRLLVVEMVNQDINQKVLQSRTLQEKIISDSVTIAKENGFSGIVLDFEFSALSFDSVVNSISAFSQNFDKGVKENNMQFFVTMYGDTFYRLRPYNVSSIAKNSDGIFVLAYDFHKVNGDPGPNFPFVTSTAEDYNFGQMVIDFLKVVPANKLTVVFGLFGYDWQITNKGDSTGQAAAITDTEIQNSFLTMCLFKNCKEIRDANSQEPVIHYVDNQDNLHVIYFEDMDSMIKKKQFLQSKNIVQTSIWAYSYF